MRIRFSGYVALTVSFSRTSYAITGVSVSVRYRCRFSCDPGCGPSATATDDVPEDATVSRADRAYRYNNSTGGNASGRPRVNLFLRLRD